MLKRQQASSIIRTKIPAAAFFPHLYREIRRKGAKMYSCISTARYQEWLMHCKQWEVIYISVIIPEIPNRTSYQSIRGNVLNI